MDTIHWLAANFLAWQNPSAPVPDEYALAKTVVLLFGYQIDPPRTLRRLFPFSGR
jgi:hypothetical protein